MKWKLESSDSKTLAFAIVVVLPSTADTGSNRVALRHSFLDRPRRKGFCSL